MENDVKGDLIVGETREVKLGRKFYKAKVSAIGKYSFLLRIYCLMK